MPKLWEVGLYDWTRIGPKEYPAEIECFRWSCQVARCILWTGWTGVWSVLEGLILPQSDVYYGYISSYFIKLETYTPLAY